MELEEFEKEFKKFCRHHDIHWDPKKGRYNKTFHNILKTNWVKSEKGFFNKEKGEKGNYTQKFDGFKL